MNRLILFICFTILFQKAAFSDCMPIGFHAWPESDTISRNPLIIFNVFEWRFSRLARPQKPSISADGIRFFLRSAHEKVALKLVQQNLGQTNEKQLIFKPVKLLDPNTKYELSFSCEDSVLRAYLLEDIRFESRIWVTNETIDKQVPVWTSKPQFWYRNYVRYGCGPESYWRFCMTFKDESEVLVQTIVRHLESGKISEFYLHPDSNSVFVGYGMCGGEFDMTPGDHYSVSFHLIDGSGNCSNQFSEPIFVQAPSESDYISDEELEKKKCPCGSEREATTSSINIGWILGIIGIIVLIAFANWYRNLIRR